MNAGVNRPRRPTGPTLFFTSLFWLTLFFTSLFTILFTVFFTGLVMTPNEQRLLHRP